METSVKEILLPIAIAALQIGVTTWIAIKLRFAKSASEVISSIKEAMVRLTTWIPIGISGASFAWELLFAEGVTKSTVWWGVLFGFSLSMTLSFYIASLLVTRFGKVIDAQDRAFGLLDKHTEMLGRQAVMIEKLARRVLPGFDESEEGGEAGTRPE